MVITMSSSAVRTGQRTYKVASIPADGIGPEVISAGIQVLDKLAAALGTFSFDWEHIDWSSETYKKHGYYIPPGGLEKLKKFDAILFGSVGAPGKILFSLRFIQEMRHWETTDTLCRRTRSHLPLEPPSRNLSTASTIRQRAPYQSPPRHNLPTQELRPGRPRLGDRP